MFVARHTLSASAMVRMNQVLNSPEGLRYVFPRMDLRQVRACASRLSIIFHATVLKIRKENSFIYSFFFCFRWWCRKAIRLRRAKSPEDKFLTEFFVHALSRNKSRIPPSEEMHSSFSRGVWSFYKWPSMGYVAKISFHSLTKALLPKHRFSFSSTGQLSQLTIRTSDGTPEKLSASRCRLFSSIARYVTHEHL